jgi:hypothetical protein
MPPGLMCDEPANGRSRQAGTALRLDNNQRLIRRGLK